jgi:hypothetical protein
VLYTIFFARYKDFRFGGYPEVLETPVLETPVLETPVLETPVLETPAPA